MSGALRSPEVLSIGVPGEQPSDGQGSDDVTGAPAATPEVVPTRGAEASISRSPDGSPGVAQASRASESPLPDTERATLA
ncbi:MAG: hypothetical protein ACI8QZ_001291 [Chlamydiales bacterium]